MAYKFNGGQGAVICDHCRIIFDSGIGFREYEETYGKDGSDGDYCWKCKTGYKEVKECRNCGSTEFNSEGNCIYCKCHTGFKK